MAILGRQVNYGLGLEAIAGTPVTATNWVNQLGFDFNPRSETVTNNSAFGVVERNNGADVLRNWSEGSLEAKLTDRTSGLLLTSAFGNVSSAANADASGNVYDHTFTINQDIEGKTLTLVRKDDVSTIAYAGARVGEWSLNLELGDYVKYSANVLAKQGVSTTATAAYSAENEFLPKHMAVKIDSNTILTAESFSLTVNPNIDPDWEFGSGDPFSFTSKGYEFNFELTCRYQDTVLETAYKDGTYHSFEVAAVNTGATIGTSANPSLVITAPRFSVTDWTLNQDLDSPVTQTLTGTIYYSQSDSKAIQAVLTNTVEEYVPAGGGES
jgi:hypothetical protein